MAQTQSARPLVGIIMGSDSDLETMRGASLVLKEFEVPHEIKIVSAHRTPDDMADYAKTARARGLKVIIAGAGGAAHLPGMTASHTTLPVIGVPVQSKALSGVDSLYSIVQMPAAFLSRRSPLATPPTLACSPFRCLPCLMTHSPKNWRHIASNLQKTRARKTKTFETELFLFHTT